MLSVNDNPMLPKKNIIKDFWQSFLSLDLFTRLTLIIFFLIIAVTPYIVANSQIFTSSGQRRLDREIVPTTTPPTSSLPTLKESLPSASGIRAFPGAEGWGAVSVGGRGGKVIEVTTLADSARGESVIPGSLRACAEASGPRICVFRVGGTIQLSGGFRINNPYLTIAGQTAPGGGILIKGNSGIGILTHDVIIRYLRFRLLGLGSRGSGQVNIGIGNGAYNVIVDHCSTSWSLDENIQIFIKESPPSPAITNVTVQRCLIAEGLAGHGTGLLISGQDPSDADPNLPTDVYLKVHEISAHHNLFAHNYDRNPRVSAAGTQVINNVVYNWGSRVGVSSRKNTVDFINNYWKKGPMSGSLIFKHESTNTSKGWVYPDPSIYIAGNIVKGSFENPTADNWTLIIKDPAAGTGGGPLPLSYRRYTPLPQSPTSITIESATDAYASVLADAGANARLDCQGNWVPNSDSVDIRILADVKNGTGWTGTGVVSPAVAGGFPVIASGAACTDTDKDGMPNEFENLHGFNANDPSDNSKDADGDGYLNLEEYLNGADILAPTATSTPTPEPTVTPIPTPTPTSTPTPQPTSTLTPTSIPGTLTSTPTQVPPIACAITNASWISSANPVTEGDSITLSVITNDSPLCAGKQVAFEVRENDSLLEGGIDDTANTQLASAAISGSTAITTWTAEWQNDCAGFCNPPEYFFNASLTDNPSVTTRSSDPLLSVNQAIGLLPTPTLTPIPTETPSSYNTPSYGSPSYGGPSYGTPSYGTPSSGGGNRSDLNKDGKINIFDLSILLRDWGK